MAVKKEEQNQQAKKEIKSSKSVPTEIITEIITEILLKLPVESLLRCKSVCKLWYSLISDPYFVKSHLSLSSRSNHYASHRLVFVSNISSKKLMSCSLSEVLYDKFVNALELDYPLKQCGYSVQIIGSCNGLLCIKIYSRVEQHPRPFFIWNPSTRISKRVAPYSCKPCYVFDVSYVSNGFGYDESTDDYKLVIIPGGDFYGAIANRKVHIYSLKTGKWKEIDDFNPNDLPVSDLYGTFLNGALHWKARTISKDSGRMRIACLDLAKETFSEILLPEYNDDDMSNVRLGTLGEMLCVACTHEYGNCNTDLWVMKVYGVKDSWTKLVSIRSYVTDSGEYQYFDPFCSLNDTEVVLTFGKTSYLYDIKNTSYSKIQNVDENTYVYTSFVESLVSP